MPSIFVKNTSGSAVSVFVSKYTGGNDEWFTLEAGKADSWSRADGGWELVAFQQGGHNNRSGVYVQAGTSVIFHALNQIKTE